VGNLRPLTPPSSGPAGEGPSLAFLEVGEQRQVGLVALLVGAEKVTEFDEFVPQGDGPQVVWDDPLGDLRLWWAVPRRC